MQQNTRYLYSTQMFFRHPNLNIFNIEIIFTFKSALLPFSLLSHLLNFSKQKSRIIFNFFYIILTLLNMSKIIFILFNFTASILIFTSTISCWVRGGAGNSWIRSFFLQTILTLQWVNVLKCKSDHVIAYSLHEKV